MQLTRNGGGILLADSDAGERNSLARTLTSHGYRVTTACDGHEVLAAAKQVPLDGMILEFAMPGMNGFEVLRALHHRIGFSGPAILIGADGVDLDLSAVGDLPIPGLWCMHRPLQISRIEPLLEGSNDASTAVPAGLGRLTGSSAAMLEVYETIRCLAPTSAPVVITGETGAGKEMVARSIHQESQRSGPYVAVNCANLPESLMESELFGYEKGAFTGALRRNEGCFEQANGGTLLLDEITELPLPMQAKLLRILETHSLRRLGGTGEIPVDVRILAATNQPLEEALSQRCLREDLYYRLNVGRIDVPPLRQRRADIPVLAESLLGDLNRKNGCQVRGISSAAMARLTAHAWPGNVRELRNVLELAAIVAGEGNVEIHHLPGTLGLQNDVAVHDAVNETAATAMSLTSSREPAANYAGSERPIQFVPGRKLREVTHEYILATVENARNRQQAARQLGISVRSLYNHLAAIKRSQGFAD